MPDLSDGGALGVLPVDLFMRGVGVSDALRSRTGSAAAMEESERKLRRTRRFVRFRAKANGHNIHTKAAPPPAPDEAAAAVRAYLDRGGTVTRCPDMAAGDFNNGDGFGA